MIVVYYAFLDDFKSAQISKKYAFPLFYRKRLDKFRFKKDSSISILGKLILRSCLRKEFDFIWDMNFLITKYGRPYIPNANFDFNISHSKNLVVCAIVRNGRIGIDTEYIKDVDHTEFYNCFTREEIEKIESASNPLPVFYECWTRKEAILKALGTGLNDKMNTINTTESVSIFNEDIFKLKQVHLGDNLMCHFAIQSETDNPSINKSDCIIRRVYSFDL